MPVEDWLASGTLEFEAISLFLTEFPVGDLLEFGSGSLLSLDVVFETTVNQVLQLLLDVLDTFVEDLLVLRCLGSPVVFTLSFHLFSVFDLFHVCFESLSLDDLLEVFSFVVYKVILRREEALYRCCVGLTVSSDRRLVSESSGGIWLSRLRSSLAIRLEILILADLLLLRLDGPSLLVDGLQLLSTKHCSTR